ncbi:MAG: hypothetical protein KBB11_07435 [Bacteroidales bacterium]|nr:hypothetical protein [Bacteroidales bacterium]HOY39487.1 hypothetical protein [Bacteroidales bacterium]HQP03686.1 hypothetical protein [Bacteroidales bacterium]
MKNLSLKTEEILASLKRIEANGMQQIDIDLCLQQIRELYSEVLQLPDLEKLIADKPAVEISATQPQSYFEFAPPTEITLIDEKVDPIAPSEPVQTTSEALPETNTLSEKPITAQEFKPEVVDTVVEPVKTETKPAEKKATDKKITQPSLFNNGTESETKTIGEQLGEKKTSLNEVLGLKTQQQDVVSRIQAKPITDIKAAIGIGDRFLFIRELFDGDNDLYNKTLEYLNALSEINEANEYLKANFTWNNENSTVDHFMKIVQRKFIKQ